MVAQDNTGDGKSARECRLEGIPFGLTRDRTKEAEAGPLVVDTREENESGSPARLLTPRLR
jgi:hypothetical protein